MLLRDLTTRYQWWGATCAGSLTQMVVPHLVKQDFYFKTVGIPSCVNNAAVPTRHNPSPLEGWQLTLPIDVVYIPERSSSPFDVVLCTVEEMV